MSSAPKVRVSVCLNIGQKKGCPGDARCGGTSAPIVVPLETEAILAAAANKLKLKKKQVDVARLYVWGTGYELPRGATTFEDGRVSNGTLVAISLGEPYAGPTKAEPAAVADAPAPEPPAAAESALAPPPSLRVVDDAGREYAGLEALWAEQAARREAYYEANDAWWDADGYGGATDEWAMIGDGDSSADLEHSLAFLDAARAARPGLTLSEALDGGAGVGRVAKGALLKRCERVTLLEPCERWRKQARRYLGNKRAQRCAFEGGRLEAYAPPRGVTFDLVWVQWTLQYLIDADVVAALRALAAALAPNGLLIVKENRPVAPGKEQLVQVDVPDGPHGRHDVCRPDDHHRHLFACAALEVERWEHWGECTAWVLRPSAEPPRVLQPSLARQQDGAASVGVVASTTDADMVAIRRAALDAEMAALRVTMAEARTEASASDETASAPASGGEPAVSSASAGVRDEAAS